MRKSRKFDFDFEPKFHADWSKKRRDRGLYMYCVLFFMSRFLDIADAPYAQKFDSDDFPFYRTILSCVEAEKNVEVNF